MNERIQELARQAGILIDWGEDIKVGRWGIGGKYENMQKFAELIVKECAQACMNEGASYEEKAAGAYQSNLYVTAIKKHFGVEE
jgi:hypothetical protein